MTAMTFRYCEGTGDLPQSIRGGAVAIGNFDGFHRGHQSVMEVLKAESRKHGVAAVVLSFEPHPRDFFARGTPLLRLTDHNSKRLLARAIGLDGLVILDFNQQLSEIEPIDFVTRFLVGDLSCSSVVVGANFRFGRGRKGDVDFLRRCGATFGFSVDHVELERDDSDPISSTRIRAELASGNIGAANEMLGFRWFVNAVQLDDAANSCGLPGQRLFHNYRLEHVAPGTYAIRGACGPWPIEGIARLSEAKPGVMETIWTDEVPRGPEHAFTFSFVEKLDSRFRSALQEGLADIPDMHFARHPLSALDRAIGLV